MAAPAVRPSAPELRDLAAAEALLARSLVAVGAARLALAGELPLALLPPGWRRGLLLDALAAIERGIAELEHAARQARVLLAEAEEEAGR